MTTTIKKYSTDSGIVGDGITNDSTLTLEGAATANSTVRVYDGETLLGTTTANSSGTWSYTTGALSDGTHSFTAATTSTTSPSSGFPDASTTGVPAGTSLTNYSGTFTSSYAGQIIEGLNVEGQILVTHPGVIVRNCEANNIVTTADSTRIEDCSVVGYNGDSGYSGIVLLADNATVLRCDVSGVENGIWLEASNCLIQDNYLHHLIPWDPVRDPHSDGLQIPGGAGVSNNLILHNNFDLALASDPYADNGINACITMTEGANVDIVNNRLNGGGYTLYFDGHGSPGVDVTNNVFVGHVYGAWVGEAAGAQTFSGNVFGDTAVSSTSPPAVTDPGPPPAVTNSSPPPATDTGGTSVETTGTWTTDVGSGQTGSYDGYVASAGPMGWGGPFGGAGGYASSAGAGSYAGLTATAHASAPAAEPTDNGVAALLALVMGGNSGQGGSTTSYFANAGPSAWGSLYGWTGGHDTFAFAANFGRDVSGVSASQGGQDAVSQILSQMGGQTASYVAAHSFAADLAHASPTPLSEKNFAADDAFGLG